MTILLFSLGGNRGWAVGLGEGCPLGQELEEAEGLQILLENELTHERSSL